MVFNTGCLMTFCARAFTMEREKDNGKKEEEIRVALLVRV